MRLLGLLLLLGLLTSCSFRHEQFRAGERATEPDPEIHFVEADDYGWFWEPQQAVSALDAVRSSAQTDTIVVLFVAGWHHTARCCDSNLVGFKGVLANLQTELRKGMYSEARKIIHPGATGDVRVMGIYVGWRGESLPGWLDYATFWGRKGAAMRVGESDLRAFMMDLRNIYEQRQQDTMHAAGDRRLLGLITIGHSFGSQIVLRATSTFIEEELMQHNARPVYMRTPVVPGSGQPICSPPVATCEPVVHGFGDLVLLINPAFEAAAYQRLHALGMSFTYDAAQTPLMLTISADNDVPRKKLFPPGRILGEIFTAKPHIADDRELNMERKALGYVAEQVTHSMHAVGCDPQGKCDKHLTSTVYSHPDPTCTDKERCQSTWYEWEHGQGSSAKAPDSLDANLCTPEMLRKILTHDFSGTTIFGDVVLEPSGESLPHQAMLVTSATPEIIDGHNGMFSQPLIQFLIRYIGFVEARRFLPLVNPDDMRGRPCANPPG